MTSPPLPPVPPITEHPRYAEVRADLETRLRGVCEDFTPGEFARLLDDMCAYKLKWESPPRRPSPFPGSG